MTETKIPKTTKKPTRKKTKLRMPLKEYIPNYRDFQRELARLEEMLGPEADPEAILDFPPGITREWAQDAWPIVKANAQQLFGQSKPGTEFPSGVYADRAMWALLVVSESPFNDRLRTMAISQMLDVAVMKERAFDRRLRAERKAAKAAAANSEA
jgi:hypothetical protein